MNVVLTISSDSDSDEDCSDVEFVGSYHISVAEPKSTMTVLDVQDATINPSVLTGEREATKALPDVKLHERRTNVNENTLMKKAKQEDNELKRTWKHDTSNELDLHMQKSSKQGTIPKKHPFLETRVTEATFSGQNASLSLSEDAMQRSMCPGQPHSAHADEMDDAAFTPASCYTNNNQEDLMSTCDRKQDGITISQRATEDVSDIESNRSDHLSQSVPVDSPCSISKSEDLDGCWAGGREAELDSPTYFMWQGESDGEGTADVEFRGASQDERHFVCPRACQILMDGLANTLMHEENVKCDKSIVGCQQRLSLVYITMDENYHEGTLQLLSDLLHPGYCLPKDVTSHVLSGILLDAQCPRHLCVRAWNLLMRTQRHHLVDKKTVPWSWEMLTAVMSTQDEKENHRPEVVRMLLEYIVQTLEDDFSHKKSTSELHHSIARATLSCNQHFPQVQDVIKWLFSAIMKSTESEKRNEAAREKDEHIRIVSILQRMLCLALEVDRSPALSAMKLSQELFFTLISIEPLRAHRVLLLDSLQNHLLRWKLLEHLLDQACPLKMTVPMSLSRLLHFLENCTLAADPTDDGERWKKWEELVQHLWMLLVSYNTTMKGYLYSSVSKEISRPGSWVYKTDDMVTKAAICKSVEAFLSRSQADVGQALPPHVEESLTYLQDFLLDVCEC
ncbi:SUMO-interacting motif-containing protein 1 isoform X1 [Hippocampus comes]|nr:PREDICTED: SUMO-interacting motif-containing protein 1 isoform X1 [Hippocampus comes]XP_019730455.1 PREDICTED: SUMO-interacting motif-containing protein 1 isoform X1 [Hippocampus comes]